MRTSQIIICSYPKDFPWLRYCLRSLNRFAEGFLPTIVCVDVNDAWEVAQLIAQEKSRAQIKITRGRPGQGFMRAQIAMMMADVLCTGDNLFFLGSDCIAFADFRPEPYLDARGHPAVLYSSYEVMEGVHPGTIPWRKGVERVLGFSPDNEYMRRLPSVFPREIFAPMRRHVESWHKPLTFDNYIYQADAAQTLLGQERDTSEANILGAFANYYAHSTCHWVDIAAAGMNGSAVNGWPSSILQLWSHGGLDRPTEACVILPDGTPTVGKTPKEICEYILK